MAWRRLTLNNANNLSASVIVVPSHLLELRDFAVDDEWALQDRGNVNQAKFQASSTDHRQLNACDHA